VSDFGDADPEDAWDDEDTPVEKVGVLERWVPSLQREHDDPAHNHGRLVVRLLLAKAAIAALIKLHDPQVDPDVLTHARDRVLELIEEEGP
jgi:hypothetical protein